MSVNITIDGRKVTCNEGKTILQAAKDEGIYIPSLCYHPKTGPASKCRICVVEVEGARDLQTACSVPVTDGMVVRTATEQVLDVRRMVVDLLLSNGTHDCLSCEANGVCELQDAAYRLGIEKPRFIIDDGEKPDDTSSEMIVRKFDRCIKCGRCIEGCNRTVVNEVLDFGQRANDTKVMCDDDLNMGESTCVQCGECAQLCPVGAIIDKNAIGKGRTWELKKVDTVCPYCGVGCRMTCHVDEAANRIVRITGVEGAPANDGMLCVKGRYGYDFANSPERLTTPLIREGKGFREATWEEATDLVAKNFMAIKKKHGPDAIAGLSSAKVTNEENYAFQKFMRREIGTNNVDHCARLCHSSTVAGLASALGSGAMTNDIAGIKDADVILVTGSDTTTAHPVIAGYIKQAVRFHGTKLIVVDPKEIELAKMATIYARQRCGTDVAVFNGMMHLIIKNGWYDKDYVEQRCENFEELKKEVEEYTPERVSDITGIPEKTIKDIAKLFGTAETASIFYSMGITQHTTGTDNVWSTANLQMLCGNFGKSGGGVNPLRGQCNVQGACDLGALPVVYSGYQKVVDEKAREKFGKAWGRALPEKPGLTVTEMVGAAGRGDVKALYIMGENPMLSDPDLNHVREALEKTEFLVVQDIFMTETAELAHVVLPAASAFEKDGHYTNTERRIQRLNRVRRASGQAKEDWQIVQDIANAMGSDWKYRSARDICDEINELTPSYGGITWDRVGTQGLQWPCPTLEHPGTPFLHKDKFTRGKGLMKAIPFKEPDELPDEEYPLTLTTGRRLEHFHTGTMTRKSVGLNKLCGPQVLISTEDAKELGIRDKETVKIASRRGEIEAPAVVTDKMGKGTVFIPFHFKEAAANVLTNPATDPVCKIPEFKVCAVKVSKARPQA